MGQPVEREAVPGAQAMPCSYQLQQADESVVQDTNGRAAGEQGSTAIIDGLRSTNRDLEAHVLSLTALLAEAKRALSHEADERYSAQERFQLAVESAPNAMVMIDHTGRITLVNRQTEDLFGYDRAELLGQTIEVLVPERFRIQHPSKVAGFFANPAARAMGAGHDLYGQRRDGSEFPVEIGLNPIRTLEGLFVLSAIVDITERKRAEEVQRQSNMRFRGIFDHTFGFIALLKPDGAVLDVNKPALDFRGLSLADVVDHLLWETEWFDVSPECRKNIRQAIELAASGKLARLEITVQDNEGGARVFDFTTKPLLNGAGVVELLIAEGRDTTEHKKLEAQFRQSQKMEAVGLLAGGIAHEFNNLLQAICGYTSFAISGTSPDDQRYHDLQLVLKSAERATVLTRQLLSFGRGDVLQRTQIDPNLAVVNLAKLLRPLIGENIDLQTQLATNVAAVYIDAGQLQQALLNLCINARDAMPGGGHLMIGTQNISLTEQFCANYPGLRPGEHVLLTMADTGCGMTPDVKARIFEPFFTTKEVGRGTGLGLAMVYGMVEQHEGVITVDSELGVGTTFKIYLPIGGEVDAATAKPLTNRSVGGKETILFAEDESMVRDLTVRILTRAGYSVLAATDGAEAVELFEAHAADISLALLDAVMPVLTGHQVYDRLQLKNPDLPVVFCTGYDPETAQIQLLVNQGVRIIQKPCEPDELLRTVRSALDEYRDLERSSCTS